jgi:hypothetical protein
MEHFGTIPFKQGQTQCRTFAGQLSHGPSVLPFIISQRRTECLAPIWGHCLGMFVNVYCDETWNTAIDVWVRNGLLEPGEVPCNSRWLYNCENKSWEQF